MSQISEKSLSNLRLINNKKSIKNLGKWPCLWKTLSMRLRLFLRRKSILPIKLFWVSLTPWNQWLNWCGKTKETNLFLPIKWKIFLEYKDTKKYRQRADKGLNQSTHTWNFHSFRCIHHSRTICYWTNFLMRTKGWESTRWQESFTRTNQNVWTKSTETGCWEIYTKSLQV